MKNYYVVIILVWLMPILGYGQLSTLTKIAINSQSNQATSTNPDGFVEYLPANFDDSGNTKYPVLYWLHGVGERGDGSLSALDKVYNITMSNWLKSNDIPFIVLMPQDQYGYFGSGAIENFVKWSNEEYGDYLDFDQQHMAGLSGGGYGMRIFIIANSSIAQSFATYTLMSTDFNEADNDEDAQKIIDNNQHVWFHHGTIDGGGNTVERIRGFHQKVYDLDAERSRLTAYVGMGHSAWHEVYDASGQSRTQLEGIVDGYNYHQWTNQDDDWYTWMLSRSKSLDTSPLPNVDPSITNTSTTYATMSSFGLVVSQEADSEATYLKITNINGGELYYNDGTTRLYDGGFISFGQGELGLKFLPQIVGTGSFDLQSATSNTDNGLIGNVITAEISISKSMITVTADDFSREYGEPNPNFTFSYSGFLLGQNESVIDTPPSISTSANQSSEAGNYDIVLSGGSDNHYEFSFVNSSLSIFKTELHVPFVTDVIASYGAFNTQKLAVFRSPLDSYEASHFKVTNVSGGELYLSDGQTMVLEGDFLTFVDGSHGLKFLPQELDEGSFNVQASISEDDSGLRSEIVLANITVTKAALTISVDDVDILQGDELPIFTGNISGLNDGDEIEVIFTTSVSSSEIAGDYPITATIIDPDSKIDNYEVIIEEGILTVNESNGTYVPDDAFEQALIDLGYDDVLDDMVLTQNIAEVTSLYVQDKGISDLTGIEDFELLTDLDVSSNELIVLDVTNNGLLETLICHSNSLTSLDLSGNPDLTLLYCQKNQLSSIDLSQNTSLNDFYARYNSLTYLNLSTIDNLSRLNVYNNDLNCIEVSQNQLDMIPAEWYKDETVRYGIYCTATYVPDDNFEQALINLGYDSGDLDDYVSTDIIQSIISIDLAYQGISDFTGLMDFQLLATLNCQGNLATILDISGATNLTVMNATNSTNLTCIQVNEAQLNDVPVGWSKDETASYSRFCTSTYVPDQNFEQAIIDLGYDDLIDGYVLNANIELVTKLNLEGKDISDATGIEGFVSLVDLVMNFNSLTTLDLSGNPQLKTVSCHSNSLVSLNVASNPELTLLYCQKNELTEIDLTQNTKLSDLYITKNELGSLDLANNMVLVRSNIEDNPNMTCIRVNEDQLYNIPTTWYKDVTASYSISCSSSAKITTINLPSNELESINLYPNPAGDFFTLDMGTLEHAVLEIYDESGKQIFDSVNLTDGENKVSTQGLSEGLIILRVVSENSNTDLKLLIK